MVRIPFRNKLCPMRRLALINFEKEPDELYGGLELQYLEGEPYGTGWRVLAYRKDGYVDVYDSKTLAYQPEDKVEVAGKGRKGYKHTEIDHVVFNFGEHGIEIGFRFFDIQNRRRHSGGIIPDIPWTVRSLNSLMHMKALFRLLR